MTNLIEGVLKGADMAHSQETGDAFGTLVVLVVIFTAIIFFGPWSKAQGCERPEVYVHELVDTAWEHKELKFRDSIERRFDIVTETRCDSLWEIRNGIYAGHGYNFQTEKAQKWAREYTRDDGTKPYRNRGITSKTIKLTKEDVSNRDFILGLEKKYGCEASSSTKAPQTRGTATDPKFNPERPLQVEEYVADIRDQAFINWEYELAPFISYKKFDKAQSCHALWQLKQGVPNTSLTETGMENLRWIQDLEHLHGCNAR